MILTLKLPAPNISQMRRLFHPRHQSQSIISHLSQRRALLFLLKLLIRLAGQLNQRLFRSTKHDQQSWRPTSQRVALVEALFLVTNNAAIVEPNRRTRSDECIERLWLREQSVEGEETAVRVTEERFGTCSQRDTREESAFNIRLDIIRDDIQKIRCAAKRTKRWFPIWSRRNIISPIRRRRCQVPIPALVKNASFVRIPNSYDYSSRLMRKLQSPRDIRRSKKVRISINNVPNP